MRTDLFMDGTIHLSELSPPRTPTRWEKFITRCLNSLSRHQASRCIYCKHEVRRYHVARIINRKSRTISATTYVQCVNPDCPPEKENSPIRKLKKKPLPRAVKWEERQLSRIHWIYFLLVQRHYPTNRVEE